MSRDVISDKVFQYNKIRCAQKSSEAETMWCNIQNYYIF